MNFKVGYIADLAVPNQVIFFSMPDFNVPGTKLQHNVHFHQQKRRIVLFRPIIGLKPPSSTSIDQA